MGTLGRFFKVVAKKKTKKEIKEDKLEQRRKISRAQLDKQIRDSTVPDKQRSLNAIEKYKQKPKKKAEVKSREVINEPLNKKPTSLTVPKKPKKPKPVQRPRDTKPKDIKPREPASTVSPVEKKTEKRVKDESLNKRALPAKIESISVNEKRGIELKKRAQEINKGGSMVEGKKSRAEQTKDLFGFTDKKKKKKR